MERTRSVGDKAKLTVSVKNAESSTQFLNGKEVNVQKQEVNASMTATIEVLELHENKENKRVAIQIEKFSGEIDGQALSLKAGPRVIVTETKDGMAFVYEGGEEITDEKTVQVLSMLSELVVEDGEEKIADDKIFKLTAPRSVGDAWQANHQLMAQDMAGDGALKIDEKDITSNIKFEDIEAFNNEQCARLNIKVTMANLGIPSLAASGFTLEKSGGVITLTGLTPLDKQSIANKMNMSMQMNFTAKTQIPQGTLLLKVATMRTQQAEFTSVD
ncbi:MAG: hypothetical protein AB8C95_09210 [Phycisphaeraceae bacterium]